jgi:hypothetical protein
MIAIESLISIKIYIPNLLHFLSAPIPGFGRGVSVIWSAKLNAISALRTTRNAHNPPRLFIPSIGLDNEN